MLKYNKKIIKHITNKITKMNNFTEHIDKNGKVLIWTPEKKYNNNQVLGLDLDWTLIKPIEGKIHSKHKDDWEFLPPNFDKLTKYNNYKLVIFTNQGGLLKGKTGINLEEFKYKWLQIYEKLKLNGFESVYLLAALYDDYYRKPCKGMWEYMETHLNGNIKVNRDKSLFIGDMAGRKGDYSESDLLMAMNLGVNFQVPEVFWNDDKKKLNNFDILKKNILENEKIFNPDEYIKNNKNTENNDNISKELIKYLQNDKILILFVGSPASGKSSFYYKYLDNENLKYMSMDKYNGTLAKFIKDINNIMTSGNNIIIDNTNGTKDTRAKYVKIANDNNYKIIVVQFDIEKKLVMHLNELRNKEINVCELNKISNCKKHLPTVAINTFWKKFENPEIDEGFEKILISKFEIDFSKKEHITEEKFKLFI